MTIELEESAQKRLDESLGKQEALLAEIKRKQSEQQDKWRKMKQKRHRETIEELDEKIDSLEIKHTTISMPIAEEKLIMREIKSLKRVKGEVEIYNKVYADIQSLKKEQDELQEKLDETRLLTAELSAILEKIKLANKLECTAEEIESKEITCPKAKIGMVIGKNGSKIKQIQDSCKVLINVDNDTEKMTLTGNKVWIERAIQEIEHIIEIEEKEFVLEPELLNYLTAKYVDVIQKSRDEYVNAVIDVSRAGGKLSIRGIPKDIEAIKKKCLCLGIESKERQFEGVEVNILLGLKGVTIDRLCSEYKISVTVGKSSDNKTTPAVFIGKPEMIEAALKEVDELIYDSKEVTEGMIISTIMKNILLADGGIHIKALQTKVVDAIPNGNCFLTVSKDRISKENPEFMVKAKQAMITEAVYFVRDRLKELDRLVGKISVDPYVVPRIIGKGGETVKKMTEGKSAFVEVDKSGNEVCFGATSDEAFDELRTEIDEVIESNCIARIEGDPAILKRQYHELIKLGIKKELGEYWLDINEDESCYIVRGKKEGIDDAKAVVEKFVANNQFGEVSITDEDRDALLINGSNSKIAQFQAEIGVHLQIDREALHVIVRGPKDKVDEATKKLDQYLFGSEGYSVAKLSVNDQVVGKIIGKKGKTRQQLEKKYEGVLISISRSHVVTIRGPTQAVADCKVEIAKMIASANVSQIIEATEEQIAKVAKRDYLKKIYQEIRVKVSFEDEKITVSGTFYDVRHAVSLLNETLTGEYKTSIELDAMQFSRVRNIFRDPSHRSRMEDQSGAKIELDLKAGSIILRGKRGNVKQAKNQVYGFLDFSLDKQLLQLKINKPLFLSVGQASALAEVSAEAGGVSIHLDRDLSVIVIRSTDREKLDKAKILMDKKIKEAEKLVNVLNVIASDSWVLPVIIGSGGSKISAFRSKYPTSKIDISKESRTITIVADSEEIVENVRADIESAIEQAKKENIFVFIPGKHKPSFVGKNGSHVKELAAKYEVKIQEVKRGKGNFDTNFKISGEESNVNSAREAVEAWLILRDKANEIEALTFTLERDQDIAVILGQKGTVARSIEEKYKCKVNVDKETLIVTVKGHQEEQRKAAVGEMNELIQKHRAAAHQASVEEQKQNAELPATRDGSKAEVVANGAENPPQEDNFPTQPVGIASKSSKNVNNKKKRLVNTSNEKGTDVGNRLFEMLMCDT
mmetsp:Transcript_16020/g.44289  ORF Transcript_16020/g.44289 Transcript_16020/m.44289 type:complete len:1204 (+) Transcript_16020:74-3685(+)|eukprot:CAMPEP_0172373380 /NCGR_PEP_ID=MMETSP1060-20121228/51368_1 /TAXON_ID=37318 /ORGANISM="Pseudo-nitzschia pungens, Strain cf. cingulata" /LENGTH=1203 /DNA_ID=CAMNT_0013099697 /DNA_START=60 /DNA_END=3671 /DNA_ORIENTATION=-